ncbi:SEC-C metal-binding domain-containing protein [Lactococcus hodotermopsidis]
MMKAQIHPQTATEQAPAPKIVTTASLEDLTQVAAAATTVAPLETSAEPKPAPRQGGYKIAGMNSPKVGRNDPCPCGSGKKYKNCHGRVTTA